MRPVDGSGDDGEEETTSRAPASSASGAKAAAGRSGKGSGSALNASMVTPDRRLAWGVFALLLASFAYFYQAGGWNENSRLDLTRALVDRHTLAIDAFHANTGDKARIGGHYYSDKAPGLAVAGTPAYLLARLFRPLVDSDHDFVVLASYLVTVLTVGLAGAWLGVLLFRAHRRLGASQRGAVIGAVAWGLGTIAFPFSTVLFGHQMAALLLFAAFWNAWMCRDEYSDARSVAAGLLVAGAVVTEFPAVLPGLVIAVYHAEPRQRRRRLATFAAGALLPAVVLAAYLTVAFGSPLSVGYGYLSDAGSRIEMNRRGLFGLTYPKPGVLVALLFGTYRGLLPYSPVLLLAFVELGRSAIDRIRARRDPAGRAETVDPVGDGREMAAAGAVVVVMLLFVSSYAWWQGGSSFGSRHLVPMLPFLALPLGRVADARPRLTVALGAVSIACMLVVTAVQPKPSDRLKNPFFGAILPAFLDGHVAAGNICPDLGHSGGRKHRSFLRGARHDAFNLGMVLGGRGHLSLLPLLSMWLASAWAFWRHTATTLGIRARRS